MSFFYLLHTISNILIFLGLGLICFCLWKITSKRRYLQKRDFVFVVLIMFIIMGFAIVHDLITMTLSPEYYIILKKMDKTNLIFKVIQLAMYVSYFPGLLLGICYLTMNLPKNGLVRLSYLELTKVIRYPLVLSISFAAFLGISFLLLKDQLPQPINELSKTLPNLALVWGIHFGTYIGGFLGSIFGCYVIYRKRRYLKI